MPSSILRIKKRAPSYLLLESVCSELKCAAILCYRPHNVIRRAAWNFRLDFKNYLSPKDPNEPGEVRDNFISNAPCIPALRGPESRRTVPWKTFRLPRRRSGAVYFRGLTVVLGSFCRGHPSLPAVGSTHLWCPGRARGVATRSSSC